MTGHELKRFRQKRGFTQKRLAAALGVSQPYLSLLENGDRPLTTKLRNKAARSLHLRPTELQANAASHRVVKRSDDQLTADLSALGYPGFSHYKPSRPMNPVDVLLSALNADKRDARLVEALPWVVLRYSDMDWNTLVSTAKLHDLQNRLGFVTSVARRMAEKHGKQSTAEKLGTVEARLENSKLEREGTLCNETMTRAERKWLAAERPAEAKHWRLLTDLSPRYLDHYAD